MWHEGGGAHSPLSHSPSPSFSKAIRYYQENLCYCPDRFDSWAGLALGRSRIILDKLNQVCIMCVNGLTTSVLHCLTQRNFKSGMEKYISKHTSGTRVCFERATHLNSKHCYIVEKVTSLPPSLSAAGLLSPFLSPSSLVSSAMPFSPLPPRSSTSQTCLSCLGSTPGPCLPGRTCCAWLGTASLRH